jgi:uncharacterized protein YndB with AHSA1/START domain
MTTSEKPRAKVFEHSIHLDAHVAEVWRAISDGEELKRWFPTDARVKPGVGGSVFLSWGPACEGEAPITLWEPGRALGWTQTHPGDNGAPVQISSQFFIQADPERGGTVLKVVQSGFADGSRWDDMYDSIANGWKFEFKSLRHYLSRHKGESRASLSNPIQAPLSVAQAWRKLAAPPPRGLLKRGSLDGYIEGDFFEFTGPDDRVYRGIVAPFPTDASRARWSGSTTRSCASRSSVPATTRARRSSG